MKSRAITSALRCPMTRQRRCCASRRRLPRYRRAACNPCTRTSRSTLITAGTVLTWLLLRKKSGRKEAYADGEPSFGVTVPEAIPNGKIDLHTIRHNPVASADLHVRTSRCLAEDFGYHEKASVQTDFGTEAPYQPVMLLVFGAQRADIRVHDQLVFRE